MIRLGRDGLSLLASVAATGYSLTISRDGVEREEEWKTPVELLDRMRGLGAFATAHELQDLEITKIRKAGRRF